MAAVAGLGLEDISLTTNGQLLARKLPLLVAAGIRRLNVSLDTLDPWRFAVSPVAAIWPACSTAWTRPAPPG
jgi:molybdenum cofactor biosynthesis enzyme MoaA